MKQRVGLPDGYERVRIAVQARGGTSLVEALAYLKNPAFLREDEVRAGPLAEYTCEHAALYRKR